jgi:transglutaminase-like putative cysteine protease
MLTAYAAGIRVDPDLTIWLTVSIVGIVAAWHTMTRADRKAAHRDGVRGDGARPRRSRTVFAFTGALIAMAALLAVIPVPEGPAQLTLPSWIDDYRPTPGDGGLVTAAGSPLLGGASGSGDGSGVGSRSGGGGYPGFSPTMDTALRGDMGDEVVLRVRAPYPDYWRGQTFTNFDGRVWTVDPEVGNLSTGVDHPIAPTNGDVPRLSDEEFIQTFYAEVDQPNIVFAAYRPERVLLEASLWRRPDGALRADVVLPAGSAYTVVSRRKNVTADTLRAEGDIAADRTPEQFVALPDGITDRTLALARQLQRATTYDTVLAIQAWLADNVEYTLDAPVPAEGSDAVDDFLFNSRQGFCEQIATATAMLLRSLGVPARIATGYVPSERDAVAGVWISRARDAHAWVEVRFPTYGWVAFDPTADVPLAGDAELGTIGGALMKSISEAIGRHLPIVLGALLAIAFVVIGTRVVRQWWHRRRRGRWGLLQDRFVAAALARGAPANAPNAELAAVFDGPTAAPAAALAATLDASAFADDWTDDDESFARAEAALQLAERTR